MLVYIKDVQESLKNSISLINNFRYLQQHLAPWLKFSDFLEGANDGTGCAPVTVSAVLSSSQEVLSASVIGVLVEDPVAIHNVTRVDVAVMETVRQTGTVIHELHHVAAEVWFFIDTQPVGAPILGEQKRQGLERTDTHPATQPTSCLHVPLGSSGRSGCSC